MDKIKSYQDDEKPIEYSFKVCERFFAGEYPGDKTSEAAQSKIRRFLNKGFTHFIDLTEKGELISYRQFLPEDVSYCRFPIKDGSFPKDEMAVASLMETIKQILSAPTNKLYLHCWGGVGRTGVIVACWYGTLLSSDEALDKLQTVFKDNPKSAWRKIPENQSQVAFVRKFIDRYQSGTFKEIQPYMDDEEYLAYIEKQINSRVIPDNSAEKQDMAMKYEYNLDKCIGCIVGGAVGDALGYPVEFRKSFEEIQMEYGPKGITRHKCHPDGTALFSDDTQMTLFTASGLMQAASELKLRGFGDERSWQYYVGQSYVDWYWTQQNNGRFKRHTSWLFEIPEMHSRRGPGLTCLNSLHDMVRGVDSENDSKGCGGIMRVAPVALCSDLRDTVSAQFMYMLAGKTAYITHNAPLGFIPAAFLVMLMDRIIRYEGDMNHRSLERMVWECMTDIKSIPLDYNPNRGTYAQFTRDIAELGRLMLSTITLVHEGLSDLESIERLGGGWTGETALAIALYCALKHTDSFEDAVVAAVNHSGDSDSTGAICGNIMGLIHGYDAIPQYYKENLELLPILKEVAIDLYTGCTKTEDLKRWKRKYLDGHWPDRNKMT